MVLIYTPGYPSLFPPEDGWPLCFERFESFFAVFGSKEQIVRCSFKVKTWETCEWLRGYKGIIVFTRFKGNIPCARNGLLRRPEGQRGYKDDR